MPPPREPRAQRRQEPQALSKSLCCHSGFTKSPQTREGGLHKGPCLGSRLCAQVLRGLCKGFPGAKEDKIHIQWEKLFV